MFEKAQATTIFNLQRDIDTDNAEVAARACFMSRAADLSRFASSRIGFSQPNTSHTLNIASKYLHSVSCIVLAGSFTRKYYRHCHTEISALPT
jgi:hypothetical protein